MSKINRREFAARIGLTAAGLMVLQTGCVVKPEARSSRAGAPAAASADPVVDAFASPPFEYGPWVYWFWLDVNVTREGITADLEAMKAVGIAGVLIMDVDQGTPASFNGAKFGDQQWYELFQFACAEAKRLGMQVNMTNDAGWCGSGGPWITPELSMQRVVWSSTSIAGGKRFDGVLPQPEAKLNFYRDIAVLAFPTPAGGYAIGNLNNQTDASSEYNLPAPAQWPALKPGQAVPIKSVLDLSGHIAKTGQLIWDAPPGQWTVLRLGHTTTGVQNHPAPDGGLGLETDKLSRKATAFQFEALMGRIVKMIGPLTGETLVATHIDSWETGSQNWTPTFPADFKRLRGYELLPYLPVFTGQVVESLEVSERFLWDLRKTVGDLLIENYAAAMGELARKHGLRLSIEGYSGEPASNLRYGGRADEPMSECWSWGRYGARETVPEMASAGHVHGRNVIGQETFTANSAEKWLGHPATVKEIGDWTFCQGVNRFVFHRYAMQPWTQPHSAPGMCMGPWGLHYERTQTWWHLSKPWHEYVARCQYLLRQGHFVADVCYVQAEGEPQQFVPPDNGPGNPPRRPGYNYDGCPAELVLKHMEYQEGFLTLPGGMKYRLLVLPDVPTMTPELLKKIKTLVDAGALVIGPKPEKSPSLSHHPHCDQEVRKLAGELWGDGKISSGKTTAQALAAQGVKPDFDCDQPEVRWIHRRTDDLDIYFVANGAAAGQYPYAGRSLVANCSFRITNAKPEIWEPETGRISPVALYETSDGMTRIPLVLEAKASVFVVFRRNQSSRSPAQIVRSISRDGKILLMAGQQLEPPRVEILAATYGKPGEPEHLRDAKADVQKLVDGGELSFPVIKVAAIGGDPDVNVVKTLEIHYRINGEEQHAVFHDGDAVDFSVPGVTPPVAIVADTDGGTRLCVTEAGDYSCVLASGKIATVSVPEVAGPLAISGPWTVKFPEGWGAPSEVQLETLVPLNQHADAGVRYFSGTASYHCGFDVPAELLTDGRRLELDLGNVAVMAEVSLNGRPLGVLWKPPFRIVVTGALRAGRNSLEIAVANLWVNRMIGDQQLPSDAERHPNGSLKSWPQWLLDGQPSPTGRFTFTTWELWRKNDALVDSGLIGPVQLRTAVCRPVSFQEFKAYSG